MIVDGVRPIGSADPETQGWWEATKQSRLLVQRCDECGRCQLYPRSVCAGCGGVALRYRDAVGRGSVYSHTTVHRAPDPALKPPYVVALVRLEEGPVVMTNIVGSGSDAISCDAAVVLRWEDLPDGRRLPLFELA